MLNVTSDNFKQEVLESNVPVICDFWATWCGPCRAIKPLLESLSNESNGKFKVVAIDVDEFADIASTYNISAIPTILIFKNGEVTQKYVGVKTKQELLSAVES